MALYLLDLSGSALAKVSWAVPQARAQIDRRKAYGFYQATQNKRLIDFR
jgi:hypothetical protein